MFSYYGGKSKIIKYYPEPKYNTIIEPFAGGARYCLRFFEKDCWINDSYRVIYDIWNWIISAAEQDIKNIPILKQGETIKDLNIDPKLKLLMGFIVNSGAAQPHLTVTKWCEQKEEFQKHIARLLKYCGKLKHWKNTNVDYRKLPNIEATWYCDPPYYEVNVSGKHRYTNNQINYQELAEWCKSRKGQVIVCENSKASWLPFKPLKQLHGQKYKTLEMIWTND